MTYSLRHKSTGVSERAEEVARLVVDASIGVHRSLGPGLFESIYEACLARALEKRGLRVERQVVLPVVYEGETLDAAYRVDLIVDRCVIVEIKAVQQILPVHRAQLLSYLKLSSIPLGFIINFHVPQLREGIQRMVL